MKKRHSLLLQFYDKVILERPRLILLCLLAGLAMLIALIAALTLLSQLLVVFKPFGSEFGEKQN
jgi:hypothetical protein